MKFLYLAFQNSTESLCERERRLTRVCMCAHPWKSGVRLGPQCICVQRSPTNVRAQKANDVIYLQFIYFSDFKICSLQCKKRKLTQHNDARSAVCLQTSATPSGRNRNNGTCKLLHLSSTLHVLNIHVRQDLNPCHCNSQLDYILDTIRFQSSGINSLGMFA